MGAYARNVGEMIAVSESIFTTTAPDGTADLTGTAFDRLGANYLELSAKFHISITDGGSGKTVTMTFKVQDSADNSSWADYTDPSAGAVPSKTLTGVHAASKGDINVDLSAARRYVRLFSDHTTMTVTASSVALVYACMVRGGSNYLPAGTAEIQ